MSLLRPVLVAGALTLFVLRPLLSTGGEAPISRAGIEIKPLPEPKHNPSRPRLRGRSIEQILRDPLGGTP